MIGFRHDDMSGIAARHAGYILSCNDLTGDVESGNVAPGHRICGGVSTAGVSPGAVSSGAVSSGHKLSGNGPLRRTSYRGVVPDNAASHALFHGAFHAPVPVSSGLSSAFHCATHRAVHHDDGTASATPSRAWVVFSGQADLPWLRCLRPGFRHCLVVMHDGAHWMTVDPMLHRMEVIVHRDLPRDFDLPRWLEQRGQTVLPAAIDITRRTPAPWRPFTCVEAVKRILGIHARFVLTPWQLYRHLGGVAPAGGRARRGGLSGLCPDFSHTMSHPLQKEFPAWAA